MKVTATVVVPASTVKVLIAGNTRDIRETLQKSHLRHRGGILDQVPFLHHASCIRSDEFLHGRTYQKFGMGVYRQFVCGKHHRLTSLHVQTFANDDAQNPEKREIHLWDLLTLTLVLKPDFDSMLSDSKVHRQ